MKLTKQDIINFCRDCDMEMPNKTLTKKYNLCYSAICNMRKRYFLHGINNLIHKPNNKIYSIELKMDVCKRILNGETISSLAVSLGINQGIIFAWFKKYKEMGYNGFKDKRGRPRKKEMPKKKKELAKITDSEREELNRLREKTKELEMELEILKKLNALVQERIKRETPKK